MNARQHAIECNDVVVYLRRDVARGVEDGLNSASSVNDDIIRAQGEVDGSLLTIPLILAKSRLRDIQASGPFGRSAAELATSEDRSSRFLGS